MRSSLPQNGPVMQTINVVGAVVVRGGLVYCVQRGPDGSLPGMWEFPGGKVEPGEDGPTALRREIHEELGCHVEVGEEVTTTVYPYVFATVRLTTYYCALTDGEPKLTEHAAERWLECDRLSELEWAPADVPAVDQIIERLASTSGG